VLAVAVLAGAGSLAPADPHADPARFAPWTRGAPPPLALIDLAGRRHTLADHRGKVVLVNFWATWCEPCRDEMPSLARLRASLGGRLVVLAVNYGESKPRVADFLARLGVDLPVLLDPNREAPRAWRVRVLPTSFVVGPDGRVRYTVVGEVDWTSPEALRAVRGLL